MSYPLAAGVRNIGSATMRMIPELFSSKTIAKFYAKTVFGEIADTEYEGEIKKQGDVVHIPGTPNVTVRDHTKGAALIYERLVSTAVDLSINKGKYWGFVIDDPDDVQTHIKNYVNKWAEAASRELQVAIDTEMLSVIPSLAHASNKGAAAGAKTASLDLGTDGGTALTLSKSDIVDKIMLAEQALDEQNAPDEDRYIILPPWAKTRLNLSDLKDASLTGDAVSPIRNGKIAGVRIGKFMPYISNNLLVGADGGSVACTNIIFGQKMGLTFATQMLVNQMNIDDQNSFGKINRGLQVYGYAGKKPEAIGVMFAKAA